MASARHAGAAGPSGTSRPAGPAGSTGVAGAAAVALGALVAGGTLAVGLAVEGAGTQLGTPNPPFNAFWSPSAEVGWALAAAAGLAGVVAAAPRLLGRPRSPLAFAVLTAVLALALRLALAAARHGPEGWYRVFDLALTFEGKNEYLPALPAAAYGPRFLLDRFAEMVPALPVHAAGHPPGMLLTLHALGITTAGGMAALCIAAGALAAPLTYALGRTLLATETQARVAALLLVLSPSALVMGAVSADALYATLGVGAAALLLARRLGARAAGMALLAVASLFSWALLAIGAFAALAAWARDGWRRALPLAAGCGAALVALHGGLAAALGWDPVGTVRETEAVYRLGIATTRPYWFWSFGAPVGAFAAAGLPIVASALRALVARHAAALALGAVTVVAAVAGFTKGEVERIWQPFVPLLCVAAAAALAQRRLRLVAGLLAVQALASELLFENLW